MIKGNKEVENITRRIIRKAITVNTDRVRLPNRFSTAFTAGFKIICPRYANTSMRRMGAACFHNSKTRERGTSHQRLWMMNKVVLFIDFD